MGVDKTGADKYPRRFVRQFAEGERVIRRGTHTGRLDTPNRTRVETKSRSITNARAKSWRGLAAGANVRIFSEATRARPCVNQRLPDDERSDFIAAIDSRR